VSVDDRRLKSDALQSYISSALKKVPSIFLQDLKNIYIGSFKELEDRDLTALYKNDSIYLSSSVSSYEDMVDDIIHEVAHHVETIYQNELYADGEIKQEFLQKRKTLWNLLKNKGIEIELEKFLNTDFDTEFDEFLYKTIGYPTLRLVTTNLFYSPYGSTSLREYFANGFEAFFMREDVNLLKKVSPVLYGKIVELLKLEEL
tara:strand:+ start:4192 stop:4797 length:606 start_codon:yes stop_codon:yes gene_type:complete